MANLPMPRFFFRLFQISSVGDSNAGATRSSVTESVRFRLSDEKLEVSSLHIVQWTA